MDSTLFENHRHRLDIEGAPRGHCIRIVADDRSWSGIYHYEDLLYLRAICHGHPPTQLSLDATTATQLRQILKAL